MPAMVSSQSRSNNRLSARSSTSWPLRGISAPTDRIWQAGARRTGQRGRSSMPGMMTLMRSSRRAEIAGPADPPSARWWRQGAARRGTSPPRSHAGAALSPPRTPVSSEAGWWISAVTRCSGTHRRRQRQAVDQFQAVGGKRRPGRPGGVDRGLVGVGQAPVEFHDMHVMTQARRPSAMRRS